MYDVVKADEMKIFSTASNFFSKFITNKILSSCEKGQHSKLKYFISQRKCVLFSVSAYRCMSVNTNGFRVDTVFQKHGKHFQETENEYAHKLMEDLPFYSNSLCIHPVQQDKLILHHEKSYENLNAIERFINITIKNLSEGLNIENEKFTNIVQELCATLHEVSNEEIKNILHYLSIWPPAPSTRSQNFKILWNMLDKECVKRLKQWNVSQQLLIADYWFHLRLSRISKYNSEVIYNLIQNIETLTNHQVVQLMFYINLQRKIPVHFISELEKKLESVINNVSLEEVGIICLGFFKTENKIRDSNLIQSIIKKFTNDVQSLSTVSVAAILKFFRKSLNRTFTDLYILTLHKCISYVKNWDIPTSVHLALLSSECNVYHPLLLNCVSEKLACDIAHARIKDCTKFMLSLSMFNHLEGKFPEVFLSELLKTERQDEFNSYPLHCVHAALYYAYLGIFNYDLLAKIFEKQFFDKTCFKSPEVIPVYAELDCCVEIECQDYKGPKLDISVRKELKNYRGNYIIPSKSEDQNMQTRLLSNVYESLVEIFGNEKNILMRHILPHMYSPDIIVRLSKCENESLSDLYHDYPSDQILKPPLNETWVCLMICGIYSFAYHSKQITGITAMKLRQLKEIGYKVVFLPYYNIPRDKTRRNKILKENLDYLEENNNKKVTDTN